jgi:4-hydroxybenzoate polyprenyltransferase
MILTSLSESGFTKVRQRLCYEAYSIWLFTRSDIKTILIPKSVFGVIGGLPSSPLVSQTHTSVQSIITRAPLVVLWIWIVLLPFNIDNQRRPEAVEEDKINRPYRPLPSKRMSLKQALHLMLIFHVTALTYSAFVGGLRESLLGILFGWIYNELGGSDKSWVARNAMNAIGYVTFSMGAISVASRGNFTVSGMQWFGIIGLIVFTTVQMQDLPDIDGDTLRGRRTVPLALGVQTCRWSVAILVPVWTLIGTIFWGGITLPAVVSGLIAIVISFRVLYLTEIHDDELTWRLWCLWMVALYTMPLASPLFSSQKLTY